MPGAQRAETFDPIHSHLTWWMDRMLHLADMVMEDEGIDSAVRAKVIRCLLYGSPNVADAELRMVQQEQLVEFARTAQPSLLVTGDLAQRLGGEQR
jgi:hypothetical protein